MKVTLYFVLTFLASIANSVAQDKIEGIGKFKIGKANLSLVEDLSSEFKGKIKVLESYSDYFNAEDDDKSQIYQVAADSQIPHSSGCDGVQVFYLNKYTIAEIQIKDIFLTFKDGLLIDFTSKSTKDLSDAVTLKYGKGELDSQTKIVSCVYNLTGAKADYEENTFTTTWRNESITATNLLWVYYNDKCKKQYINTFSVGYKNQMKEIADCDRTRRLKSVEAKEKEQKKKLADF